MKNSIPHVVNSWNWKSEIFAKAGDNKEKLSYQNTFNLFIKLLIRAVILAIGVTTVTGLVFEILDL
ncbi:MAG TPA: hypothetical protein VFU05_10400 [Cyclobacteriaceae bacterium]|nr:hypothetical protein [Cyclobacteriaceae bacterium]